MAQHIEPSPLPSINRYITDNDASGKAILSSSIASPSVWTAAGPAANFFLGYCTTSFPVEMSGGKDVADYKSYLDAAPGLIIPGGNVLRVVDMAPDQLSPMHRTTSLDYGVVLEGEVELVLDGGETQVLRRGDICVQRATNHAWRNTSKTEWARMLYVLSEAKPVVLESGKTLGEDLGGIQGVRKSG